jgi:peroxiredoxin
VTTALLILELTLALVFGGAGIGKLLDQPGTRKAFEDFGVRPSIAAPASALLPVAELIVAGALLVSPLTAFAAVGALGLLVVFSAGIANSLAHGRRPACHCFGQRSLAPIGWGTLVRNAALGAAAAAVAVGSSRAEEPPAVQYVELVALVALAGVVSLALASRRFPALSVSGLEEFAAPYKFLRLGLQVLIRVLTSVGASPSVRRGLPIGAAAPDFDVQRLDGQPVTLMSLLGGGLPVMLVFSDPGCVPCAELVPKLSHWQRESRSCVTIVLVTRGSKARELSLSDGNGLPEAGLVQADREVAKAYEVAVTPSAVVVTSEGTIGSRVAVGELPIRRLLRSAQSRLARGQQADQRACDQELSTD